MGHRMFLVAGSVLLAFRAGGVCAQQPPEYAFFALPSLGGSDSAGYGINEHGHVVGGAFLPENVFHATLWIETEPIDLSTLGGTDSQAFAVNDNDWVTGWSNPLGGTGFNSRGFLWRDGQMEDIGSLGGDWVEANEISNNGQVVGWSELIPGVRDRRAFCWTNGAMIDLGDFEGNGSEARDINEDGLIVGQAWSAAYHGWRAVTWYNGEMSDLGTLRAGDVGQAFASGLNNAGYVVGSSDVDFYSERRFAFIWFRGRMYDLGKPPGTVGTLGYAINRHGHVVGRATREGMRNVGFIWAPARGIRKLDDLLPAKCRWRTEFAWDINDAGQISGTGYFVDHPGTSTAFLMSPVYPTLELSTPTPGTAGVANTITVTGVTPGARVVFLYSRHGGGTRIPGCDLQQNALQLDQPTVIGTAVADANGVASITRPVPLVARGQTILFQAVVQNECAISQLVVWEFE